MDHHHWRHAYDHARWHTHARWRSPAPFEEPELVAVLIARALTWIAAEEYGWAWPTREDVASIPWRRVAQRLAPSQAIRDLARTSAPGEDEPGSTEHAELVERVRQHLDQRVAAARLEAPLEGTGEVYRGWYELLGQAQAVVRDIARPLSGDTPLRVMTYNLHDCGATAGQTYLQHLEHLAEVIALGDPDFLAVQEIAHPDAVHDLARITGLSCCWRPAQHLTDGRVLPEVDTLAPAGGRQEATYHVALLWRDTMIWPVGGTWRSYGSEMWHTLGIGEFEVGDRHLRIGSYHGPPVRQRQRADEAERVANAMLKPHGYAPATVVGADWNGLSADRMRDEQGQWRFHHPDPYPTQPWHPAYIHQCNWQAGEDGLPSAWHADRTPGETLWAAGIRDTAALAGPHTPVTTVGHDKRDPHPARAIDTWRVNAAAAPAVLSHQVVASEAAQAASDHLPVVVELDRSQLPHSRTTQWRSYDNRTGPETADF